MHEALAQRSQYKIRGGEEDEPRQLDYEFYLGVTVGIAKYDRAILSAFYGKSKCNFRGRKRKSHVAAVQEYKLCSGHSTDVDFIGAMHEVRNQIWSRCRCLRFVGE